MLDEPAVGTYAGTAEVSQEFVNFVADLHSAQEFDSMTTALLCREAYELGRKEGGICSTRETVAAILAVAATLVLLGVHLMVRGL